MSFIPERKVNPKADDTRNYRSPNSFVSNFSSANVIKSMVQEQCYREILDRRILKTLYAADTLKPKTLNSKPSFRLI